MINVTKTALPPINKYIKYLKKIWANNWVTNKGEFSIKLEQELEKFLKVKNLLAVSDGTTAMQLAYKALGLKGEVITTSFTFPATTNSLVWEGLQPVFADIDPETFNISLKVIYDSAHAFGVDYKNKSVLNWGDVNTLSFHAAKIFHTVEGGGVISKSSKIH